MFSTSLKNSILVLLLILIIHFLIKNSLLDMQIQSNGNNTQQPRPELPAVVTKEPFATNDDTHQQGHVKAIITEVQSVDACTGTVVMTPVSDDKCDGVSNDVREASNKRSKDMNDDDELYKFVYGDDEHSSENCASVISPSPNTRTASIDDELEEYFANMEVDSCATKAKFMKDDVTMPVSTTCDPLGTVSAKAKKNDKKKTRSGHNNVCQGLSMMMLNEYENESSMNGGTLYGDLAAFDEMASNFVAFSEVKN